MVQERSAAEIAGTGVPPEPATRQTKDFTAMTENVEYR
jgi:hypothetical protein